MSLWREFTMEVLSDLELGFREMGREGGLTFLF